MSVKNLLVPQFYQKKQTSNLSWCCSISLVQLRHDCGRNECTILIKSRLRKGGHVNAIHSSSNNILVRGPYEKNNCWVKDIHTHKNVRNIHNKRSQNFPNTWYMSYYTKLFSRNHQHDNKVYINVSQLNTWCMSFFLYK